MSCYFFTGAFFRKSFLIFSIAVGVFSLSAVEAFSAVVFEDTFDSNPVASNITSLPNWTVSAGNIDVIGPGYFDFYPGNGNYLDLEGCQNGTIEKSLSLAPGTYQLSFEIGKNTPDGDTNGVQVSLGSYYSAFYTAPAMLTPISVSIVVTALSTVSLKFQEMGVNNCRGTVLDDVRLDALGVLTLNCSGDFKSSELTPVKGAIGGGRAVPVRFQCLDSSGVSIFGTLGLDILLESPQSIQISCGTGDALVGAISETVDTPGDSSTLKYADDRYAFNWKTKAEWAGQCRALSISFKDGSVLSANFDFRK